MFYILFKGIFDAHSMREIEPGGKVRKVNRKVRPVLRKIEGSYEEN